MNRLMVVGLALLVIGFGGAAWSVPQLSDGIIEIPSHWWSALATLPALIGVLLLGLAVARQRT